MLIATVLVLGGVASAWWAWGYQRHVVHVLRPPAGPTILEPAIAVAATEVGRTTEPPRSTAGGPEVTERARPCSVLGWDHFSIVSFLVFDRAVLVACREHHPTGFRPTGFRAARPTRSLDTDQTIVLVIGRDHRAADATKLLDRWRRSATKLHVRPTTTPGAIELIDDRENALRAPLVAA